MRPRRPRELRECPEQVLVSGRWASRLIGVLRTGITVMTNDPHCPSSDHVLYRGVRTLLRSLIGIVALGMATLSSPVAQADSSICDNVFVGDLNNDKKVSEPDFQVFLQLRSSGAYSPCADLTRDGVLTDADGVVLRRLVDFATDPVSGGGQFRVPNITLNEVRMGVVGSGTELQQRYIELRLPTGTFPPTYAWNNTLPAGYSIIIIGRAVTADSLGAPVQGIVRAHIPLTGVQFQATGPSAGYSLILQQQDAGGPVVYDLPTPAIPVLRTSQLNFTNLDPPILEPAEFNWTILLTYRRPASASPPFPPVGQIVAPPANGQQVDSTGSCRLDARLTVDQSGLPPWDVIIDAVSLRRSAADPQEFGCNYCPAPAFGVGPITVNEDGQVFSVGPLHAWRCQGSGADSGEWRALIQDPAFAVDTPGATNRACDAVGPFCGDDAAGNCFVAHPSPACDDAACCSAVCEADPSCCSDGWDPPCATMAQEICLTCGGEGTGDCFVEGDLPSCNDLECCELVCEVDPMCCEIGVGWDADCVQIARDVCLECGDPVGNCFVPHVLPNCNDPACCSLVCNADPICCELGWDNLCVDFAILRCEPLACGSPVAGECCRSHPSPFCNDAECCKAVCGLSPFCCESQWDLYCALLAADVCESIQCICGAPEAGDCFTPHVGIGCNDQQCCDRVCSIDEFCCSVTWDESCVRTVGFECARTPGCQPEGGFFPFGSCVVPHQSPGCNDPACCDEVCAINPFCCDTVWDVTCVDDAGAFCATCGDLDVDPCFVTHNLPTCSDETCCLLVCSLDAFCCEFSWDQGCVSQAIAECAPASESCGDPLLRPCFVASALTGCEDEECCAEVCGGLDASCCEYQWDAICAAIAFEVCTLPPGSQGAGGDCLAVHPTRGCASGPCSAAVCSVAPECCAAGWDERCVTIALGICVAPNTCPAEGSCFAPHNGPGCDDPTCCNAVCSFDPTCCTNRWDNDCGTLADNLCVVQEPDWRCPCRGSCFETHADSPGCEDYSCCSAVCAELPECCTVGWDLACSTLARRRCCGPIGCGSGCNGSCLEAHASPFCDEPYCCAAVCALLPYCCEAFWDQGCVDIAAERCSVGCGSPYGQSCFSPSDGTPGCNDIVCCRAVCNVDPYCCDFEWDDVCAQIAFGGECDVPTCEDPGLGDCCSIHNGPWCSDPSCCSAVCAADSFCCEVLWDEFCVRATFELDGACGCLLECGDECAESCCEPHFAPRCNDAECCKLVCAEDAFCCDTEWDSVCVDLASQLCGGKDGACPPPCGLPEYGSCCVPHATPGCSDLECCLAVCKVDPFCCDGSWDETCAKEAGSECSVCSGGGGLACGAPTAGSCFEVHTNPYCDFAACCSFVCKYVPECCSVSWDQECVGFANRECSAFAGAKSMPPTVEELRRQRGQPEDRRRRKIRSLLPQLQRGPVLDAGGVMPPSPVLPNSSKKPK